jgi:hypothetical protein
MRNADNFPNSVVPRCPTCPHDKWVPLLYQCFDDFGLEVHRRAPLGIRNVFSKRARWANAPFMRQKKKKGDRRGAVLLGFTC